MSDAKVALRILQKALAKASDSLKENETAQEWGKTARTWVGTLLDDGLIPRYRDSINRAIADKLNQSPEFPLNNVNVNVLNHQTVIIQGIYPYEDLLLMMGQQHLDLEVRMAVGLEIYRGFDVALSIQEVQVKTLGLIGLVMPPITDRQAKDAIMRRLHRLPPDGPIAYQDGIITFNILRQIEKDLG